MSFMNMRGLELPVAFIMDEHATAAQVTVPGYMGSWTGIAKRAPGERRDDGVGLALALGRALKKMGADMEIEALGAVGHYSPSVDLVKT